ncbi:MAG TPA: hypothetical protein VK530_18990 [Candidatus Acidoferrum sp.]|nr:hypothetical protein [Candidatus Acidoferrum sp.]
MKLKLLALTVLATSMAISYGADNRGIAGSPHDFSTNSWNTRKGTCTPCHQAHHTDANQIAPLWSHATSEATFTPYSSPTMHAAVNAPSGVSLACLSCHDGTVAVNQGISGIIGSVGAVSIDAASVIGPDLHTTHPVSFVYDSALAAADGGLEDPNTYTIGSPKSQLTYSTAPVPATWSGTSLAGKTISQAMLFGGKMECASCHDVHKMEGSSPSSGILTRLSGNDAGGKGSILCRTCHIK